MIEAHSTISSQRKASPPFERCQKARIAEDKPFGEAWLFWFFGRISEELSSFGVMECYLNVLCCAGKKVPVYIIVHR